MVNNQSTPLDAIYSALGDPTRRAMLEQLMCGPAKVSDLARPQAMSLPGVMKHIGVLERAGLVRKLKKGRAVHCQLDPRPLQDAAGWIARSLRRVLETETRFARRLFGKPRKR